jgi:DNA (cytosine-5)-methyltransferase 1
VNENDDRRHLYKALVEILKAKQPRFFVFENVGGLTRIEDENGGKMIDVVCQAFTDCGYFVDSEILNASNFGVPQQRKRVYIVGVRQDIGKFLVSSVKPTGGITAIKDILESGVPEKYLLESFWKTYTCKPVTDTKFGIGPKGWGELYTGTPVNRYVVMKHLYDTAVKPDSPTGEISLVSVIYGDTPSGISRQGDRVYSRFGICPTLATFSVSIPKVDSEQGLRVLTPRECARLQGFPDSYQLPIKSGAAYKQIGNAVCVKVVEAVLVAFDKQHPFLPKGGE